MCTKTGIIGATSNKQLIFYHQRRNLEHLNELQVASIKGRVLHCLNITINWKLQKEILMIYFSMFIKIYIF